MDLQAAIEINKLKAGGPGSGRHPGDGSKPAFGVGKNAGYVAMHRTAEAHGFKSTGGYDHGFGYGAQTVRTYEHPETGHTMTISKGGGRGENFYRLQDKAGNTLEEHNLPRDSAEHHFEHEAIGDHLAEHRRLANK